MEIGLEVFDFVLDSADTTHRGRRVRDPGAMPWDPWLCKVPSTSKVP